MKLTHVTIVVKDQDRALDFYTKTMGFEKRADYTNPGQGRWLTVGPKGQDLEMVLWQAGSAPGQPLPASHVQPVIGTRWVFEVEDCRKTFDELKEHGVRFKQPVPIEADWGWAADFTDPDGNPFTIRQAKAPPAGSDGPRTGGKA